MHVMGPGLRAHLEDLLSLIIDALQDAGEGRKRDVAVLTMAQVWLALHASGSKEVLSANRTQDWSCLPRTWL